MNETPLALMDSGQANRRILSKDEHRADFRRAEAEQVQRQRSRFKRIVMALSSSARILSLGVRRRMNEAKAREDEENSRKGSRPDPVATSGDSVVPTHIEVAETAVIDDVIESDGDDLVADAAPNSDHRVMAEAAKISDVGTRASQLWADMKNHANLTRHQHASATAARSARKL